jgi:translation initiation factor 2 beta subunit (eIF-2beta)/eIF-5
MSNQKECCCFCGSADLAFEPDWDIVCKACGKIQPVVFEKETPTNKL